MHKKKKLMGRVIIYIRTVFIFVLFLYMAAFVKNGAHQVKLDADNDLQVLSVQLENRIEHTVNLLKSIREDEVIGNPELSLEERAEKLKHYSGYFGYRIMGVTDEEINVYSSNGKAGNLSRRDFMQKLYADGEVQVTDVYTAGEDGSLLIYTIAVPIIHDGKVVGSVWSSLGHDELEEIVVGGTRDKAVDMVLFGEAGRVLCSTETGTYDMSLAELNQGSRIIGGDIKSVEEDMLQGLPGSYYTFKEGALWYVAYQNVEGSRWSLMYRGNIILELLNVGREFAWSLLFLLALEIMLEWLLRRYMDRELRYLEDTLATMQDMQMKMQVDSGSIDYRDLLDISSQGLVDSLTGLSTRTVFGQRIDSKITMADRNKTSVMCFIDLDDLKKLNDVYGHEGGDAALGKVGYILRKYEKLYDGMAARYGGDEFLMFLPNLPGILEAERVLKKLVEELCSEIEIDGQKVKIHCSVGAAFYSRDAEDAKGLIIKADKALYDAKHRGKNTFSTFDV